VLLICLVVPPSSAKDAAVETVLTGLQGPRGVAVRPGGSTDQYEVFVSDTLAGRIVKLRSDQLGKSTDAITGFATHTARSQNAGPFGLLFLDRDHIVVACGSDPAVRLYELSDENGAQPADKPKQAVGNAAVNGAYFIGRTAANDKVPDMLVVTCAGHGPHGLGKIPVRAGTLDKLTPFANPSAEIHVPIGVAVGEQGFVVVGQPDLIADPPQSLLTFFNPIDGSAVMSAPVNLAEIFGLAYHPQSDNLYAIDFAPSDEKQGGVFCIDDISTPGKTACRAVRIAAIVRPTALAFGPDGALYITATRKSNGTDPGPGTLLRITGDL
jgi:hypothetical protein